MTAPTASTQITEPLVRRKSDGSFEPVLAAALPTNVDALTWDVSLRQGVKWHDGTPFDAQSVVANFSYLGQPATQTSKAFLVLAPIPAAEAINESTVRLHLSKPRPTLLLELTYFFLQKVDTPDKGGHPVGTGPFVFQEWNRGQDVILKANPQYWGPRPRWETVKFRFIPDAGARTAALAAGEVDFILDLSAGDSSGIDDEVCPWGG